MYSFIVNMVSYSYSIVNPSALEALMFIVLDGKRNKQELTCFQIGENDVPRDRSSLGFLSYWVGNDGVPERLISSVTFVTTGLRIH